MSAMTGIKRILTGLKLDKIAAVDMPCQEGAKAVIIKRAPTDESAGTQLAKSLCDALRKATLVIDDDEEVSAAETFDEVLGEQQATSDFFGTFYEATDALRTSLQSILEDDSVSDKTVAIEQSLKQFADHIEQKMPDSLGKALAEGARTIADNGINKTKETTVADESVKKALGLAADASDADVLKAIEAQSAELAKAKAAKPVPEAEPDADDMAKALIAGTAFKTPEGAIITKAALGVNDAAFAVMKSQNAQLLKQADDLAKAAEREDEATFAKRATDIGLTAEFGPTLRKAFNGDAAAQAELEKRVKGLTAMVDQGELLKSWGASGGTSATAADEMIAKRDELMKADPSLSPEQAYTKVYTDTRNVDIKKRMQAEAA